jgi:hypothetical protein
MTATIKQWQDLLGIVKIALECMAIAGGGFWALFVFGSLRQIARARAEIAKTDAERRKTEAEIERLTEQARIGAVIGIELAASSVNVPGDAGKYLSIEAIVANSGSRHAQVDYPDEPLIVFDAKADADGTLRYTRVAGAYVPRGTQPWLPSRRLLVRAGGHECLTFFVKVPSPGLYLVVLSFPISEQEQTIARQFGFETKGRWSAKRYVTVPA